MLTAIDCSFPEHPIKAKDKIPANVMKPTITFQAAIFLAEGLNFVIMYPGIKTPMAHTPSIVVPVTKL